MLAGSETLLNLLSWQEAELEQGWRPASHQMKIKPEGRASLIRISQVVNEIRVWA